MKLVRASAFLIGLALFSVSIAGAEATKFEATLSGKQQNPPIATRAHGSATFVLSKSGSHRTRYGPGSFQGVSDPTEAVRNKEPMRRWTNAVKGRRLLARRYGPERVFLNTNRPSAAFSRAARHTCRNDHFS